MKKILTIAGSDSIGGAGIQADIRISTLLNCRAATAITAVTSQDLNGIYSMHFVPVKEVASQINVVLKNKVDAIKIGMLGTKDIAKTVFNLLLNTCIPIVLDPVFIATSGASLTEDAAFLYIKKICSIAKLITPNIKEAELLSGFQIKDQEDMIKAGKKILDEGAHNVLVKGGHMQGDTIVDILLTSKDEVFKFPHKKIKIKTTHGTGCRLSCAIACNIANRIELKKAIKNSVDLVLKEIEAMHTYQS